MTPQQADYCGKLYSGTIEVAVPCENALGFGAVCLYSAELRDLGVKDEKIRQPHLAFAETTIIVSETLEGLRE